MSVTFLFFKWRHSTVALKMLFQTRNSIICWLLFCTEIISIWNVLINVTLVFHMENGNFIMNTNLCFWTIKSNLCLKKKKKSWSNLNFTKLNWFKFIVLVNKRKTPTMSTSPNVFTLNIKHKKETRQKWNNSKSKTKKILLKNEPYLLTQNYQRKHVSKMKIVMI